MHLHELFGLKIIFVTVESQRQTINFPPLLHLTGGFLCKRQADEVRGDSVPCVAGAEHSAAEHNMESLGDDEQLLVPL